MNTGTNYAAHFSGIETDIDALEKKVKEHPESSFARFLLLQHYKKINDPDFDKLTKQSVLYFSNPAWLQFQLAQSQFKVEKETEDVSKIAASTQIETSSANTKEETLSKKEEAPNDEVVFEASEDDASIEFEPLHTVDYFASQGIKLSEDALMNDKLGKQMRSFTEWLKSMKKLHPGKLPEQNEVIEKIIQTSAEASNVETEVLTEAMAEVLIKQNKKEKAIEMYQKLSLTNPGKSSYFAAKIESLKTN